jgi:hypothetical protein
VCVAGVAHRLQHSRREVELGKGEPRVDFLFTHLLVIYAGRLDSRTVGETFSAEKRQQSRIDFLRRFFGDDVARSGNHP